MGQIARRIEDAAQGLIVRAGNDGNEWALWNGRWLFVHQFGRDPKAPLGIAYLAQHYFPALVGDVTGTAAKRDEIGKFDLNEPILRTPTAQRKDGPYRGAIPGDRILIFGLPVPSEVSEPPVGPTEAPKSPEFFLKLPTSFTLNLPKTTPTTKPTTKPAAKPTVPTLPAGPSPRTPKGPSLMFPRGVPTSTTEVKKAGFGAGGFMLAFALLAAILLGKKKKGRK